jgi:2-dehydro-3-deoxyphosphogluconate aldolase/(4S)-4-hydroxy-2-oxoglutarate aldolase
MNAILERLGLAGIIPVVVIDDESHALPLAEALLKGGLATMEITYRTAAAQKSIATIARLLPGILPGAGTVLTVEQAKGAVDAGARYVVSPGLSPSVVSYCIERGIAVLPGVVTPTEIQGALALGIDVVKFFPAEASGGLAYLKAVGAAFRSVKFVPTGGIDESNVAAYLAHPQVLACGGSWMVKQSLIAGKQFAEITRLAGRAAALAAVSKGSGS